jgi:anti-sigma B factor antagonist
VSRDAMFTCRAHHASFTVFDHGDSIDVALRGEFDLSTADASQLVLEHVGELLGAAPRPVSIDLSAVSFFDASGIRFLLQLEQLADLGSTTSIVQNPTADVRRLLDMVGLQRLLKEP